jgi:hypothetical protein
MKSRIKTKPEFFVLIAELIFIISWILNFIDVNWLKLLSVYCIVTFFILKDIKLLWLFSEIASINLYVNFYKSRELLKRIMHGKTRRVIIKLILFFDYKLPTFIKRVYYFSKLGIYIFLVFVSVKIPKYSKIFVKFIIKKTLLLILDLIDFVLYNISKLMSIVSAIGNRISNTFEHLSLVYSNKKAALSRFLGIIVFVLIIFFFFIGVKPGEESIKIVDAAGGACVYETDCALCENCVGSVCTYVANGNADTLGTFQCTGTTGCSATSGDYCRCDGGGSCLTNDGGYCTGNAQCHNYCDAEDGTYETLYGQTSDNLACFSAAACDGGASNCGNQDGDCQYDPGADNNCDDYSEGSSINSGDPGYPGYCDANCGYHSEGTYKFYVKDSGGSNVASFDDAGNVIITGTLSESSATAPSGGDDFIIQNSAGTWKAWIDGATGNMYLAGTMTDGVGALSSPADSFIIQDSSGTEVAYIDSSGNLQLKGAFVAGGTP